MAGNFKSFALRNASKLSLGFVFVGVWLWLYISVGALFPNNPSAWKDYITTYIIFTTLTFSLSLTEKTEKGLFKVSFLKEIPKFILGALITGALLYAFGLVLKGSALPSIKSAFAGISLSALLMYAFVGATMEELAFRGWFVNQLRKQKIKKAGVYLLQTMIFAGFHWAISRSLWTTLVYLPLGFLFMTIRDRFSPVTNMANSGVHFAWNVFILGFMS